jgi:hypothetical protein
LSGYGGAASDVKKSLDNDGFSSTMTINASLSAYVPVSKKLLIGSKIEYIHVNLTQNLNQSSNQINLDQSMVVANAKYYFSKNFEGLYVSAGAGEAFGVSLIPGGGDFMTQPSFGIAQPRSIGYNIPLCGNYKLNFELESSTSFLRGGAYTFTTFNMGIAF